MDPKRLEMIRASAKATIVFYAEPASDADRVALMWARAAEELLQALDDKAAELAECQKALQTANEALRLADRNAAAAEEELARFKAQLGAAVDVARTR